MKSRTLLLLMLISSVVSAQNGWEVVYNSPTGQFFRDISFVPDNNWQTGFVIAFSGDILKTTDGGDTWTTYTQSFSSQLGGCSFVNASTGYICTLEGKILKTTDGAVTWSQVYVHPQGWGFDKIAFKDELNGVVVGMAQCFWTSDGGVTWNLAPGTNKYSDVDYGSGGTYFATAFGPGGGEVGKTTDDGHTWTKITQGVPAMLFGVDFYDANTGLVGGDPGLVKTTHDGGTNWTDFTITPNLAIAAACFFDTDTAYVGGPTYIYKSTDGGTSWAVDYQNSAVSIRGMVATPNNVIHACGAGAPAGNPGMILRKHYVVAQPEISVNPTALEFDSTVVNQSSTMQTTVKNTGTGILVVSDITSDNPAFTVSPVQFSLGENEEQVVDVTFAPEASGGYSGTLSIINNSSTPLVDVICTGEGVWPVGIPGVTGSEPSFQCIQNPITDTWRMTFSLPEPAMVRSGIMGLRGETERILVTGMTDQGVHHIDLADAISLLPAGMHIVWLQAADHMFTSKLIVTK